MKLPAAILNRLNRLKEQLKRIPELARDPRVKALAACLLTLAVTFAVMRKLLARIAPGIMLDKNDTVARKMILDAASLTQKAVQDPESPTAYPAAVEAQALTAAALRIGDTHRLSAAMGVNVDDFAKYVRGLTS